MKNKKLFATLIEINPKKTLNVQVMNKNLYIDVIEGLALLKCHQHQP